MEVKMGRPYPMFEALCLNHGLPQPEREYHFHKERDWRFDFAWVFHKVALEVEGGAFRGKGHRSVGKYLRDIEKYNEAMAAGWKPLRCTTDDLENLSVFRLLKRVLQPNGDDRHAEDMLRAEEVLQGQPPDDRAS